MSPFAYEETADFAVASGVERVEDRLYRASLPRGWEQGRGVFGGLVVAVLLRAMEAEVPEDRPLRAITAEIPSPVAPGGADVRLTLLREGSALTSLEAHLVQQGEIVARASGIFAKPRPIELAWEPSPPALEDWREVPVLPDEPDDPPFTRFFEYRSHHAVPFGTGGEPVVSGWVRPRAPLQRWGAPEVVALADTYWPAFFPMVKTPRPAATIAFTLHTTPAARGLEPAAPLYYQSRAHQVAEGFLFEERRLWTAEGELVALNPQTFAIIR